MLVTVLYPQYAKCTLFLGCHFSLGKWVLSAQDWYGPYWEISNCVMCHHFPSVSSKHLHGAFHQSSCCFLAQGEMHFSTEWANIQQNPRIKSHVEIRSILEVQFRLFAIRFKTQLCQIKSLFYGFCIVRIPFMGFTFLWITELLCWLLSLGLQRYDLQASLNHAAPNQNMLLLLWLY